MTQAATDVRLHVDAYRDWLADQHLPVLTGHFVSDLNAVELEPWELTGGRAAFIYLEGSEGTSGAYVCEILPGASLRPQRHMFEELIYILSGRGTATVWGGSGRGHNFEWQAGSLFAIPLNARYQLFNASGREPARFVAVTTAPLLMNYFHNSEFIFSNPFNFVDRFDEEADYFSGEGRMIDTRQLETNFVPDVRNLELEAWVERGGGGTNMSFALSGNTFGAHTSEIAPGNYKKAHRHGGGAHILILSGDGFSLMWPEGGEKVRVDWKPGAFFSPPDIWWHQHLNISDHPARYLAFRWGSRKFSMPRLFQPDKRMGTGKSQIEYEEEEPEIRRDFDAARAEWQRKNRN